MYTIDIQGTHGEVMAPFVYPGVFIRGKRIKLVITGIGSSDDVPVSIREKIVNLSVSAVFTKQQILEQIKPRAFCEMEAQLPEGCLIGYVSDVIRALEAANHAEAAAALQTFTRSQLDLYVFEPGTFEVIPD